MNRFLLILFLVCVIFHTKIYSQIIDSFTESSWYIKNNWAGQIEEFKVNEDKQLQTFGSLNGKSTIYASYNTSQSQEWQLWCKLNFAPSEANKLRVYLYAEDTSFKNSYYLEIGENGNQDAIKFYKSIQSKATLLAEGNIGAASKDPTLLRLRLSKSDMGDWTINTDYNGGFAFTEEIIVTDNSIPFKASTLFAIECNYTATRRDKFLFDDLVITKYVPKVNPPKIIKIESDSNQVNIFFDKALDPVTASDEENYLLSGSLGQPWKARLVSDSIVILNIAKNIPPGKHEIICNKISDLQGNTAFNLKGSWTYTVKQNLNQFDLLITEIMADPTPVAGLPPFEYIEILNKSTRNLDLAGIKLYFEKNEYSMDTNSLMLKPGEYILLCELAAAESFKPLGNTFGLKRMPSLRNTNGSLTLKAQEKIIHSVPYDDDWYRDTKKKEGGWSLEMINPENVCDDKNNWIASADVRGGSPGFQNSVWNVNGFIPLTLDSFVIQSDNKVIDLYINKKLGIVFIQDLKFNPVISVNKITYTDSIFKINLQLADPLVSGIVYSLTTNLKDCVGKALNPASARFSRIEKIEKNDLVINEVLFNPPSGGVDYIELYNKSSKAFTVQKLRISNEVNQRSVSIINNSFILPGTYFVISSNTIWIKNNYVNVDTGQLIEHSLPSLPDDEGNISIWSPDGILIDSFFYNEKFHYALLNTKEGVALERIDVNNPQNKSNWHSAAATDKYGTPARKNSVSALNSNTDEEVFTLKNKTFSPDGDGTDDDLLISYTLPDNGFQSQIVVFDDQGRRIRRLYNNVLLSRSGEISWDGKNDQDQIALNGIYIVNIEAFTIDGKRVKKKMSVVLYR